MTVMPCPSIANFCVPSVPALMSLNLCFLPGVSLKVGGTKFLSLQVAVSPEAFVEQSKKPFPWMRLLSDFTS